MVKTFLKQLILEECINTFFDKVIYNFTPIKQEDVSITYKEFYGSYYFYITIKHQGKPVTVRTACINIENCDPVKYGKSLLENSKEYSQILRLSLYEYLTTFYNKC